MYVYMFEAICVLFSGCKQFMFCLQTSSDERVLVVSTDSGKTWNHARVPSITSDRVRTSLSFALAIQF